ncbi:MAG: putative peptidoglycan-binding domain-containing protein [Pikeienuella sp.]
MIKTIATCTALVLSLILAGCAQESREPFSPNAQSVERRALTLEMVQHIVDFEARRDENGKIVVYNLPVGDGGGLYEVAGINERYHPAAAARLRDLIDAGDAEGAEREAVLYIASKTNHPAAFASTNAIKFLLRDIAWNRGPTGAAKTLQIALKVRADGIVGPITRKALRQAEANPAALIDALRSARETYERQRGRSENSPFWAGLVNRWNNAGKRARTYL